MHIYMYFIKYKKLFYLYFAKYTFYLIVLLPFVCITFPEIGSPLVAGAQQKDWDGCRPIRRHSKTESVYIVLNFA